MIRKEDLLDWIKDNKSKFAAIVIAVFYLLISFFFGHQGDWAKMLSFLILPLACILFSDAMGSFEGWIGRGPAITKPTPGCFVALAGWALLLMPLVLAVFMAIFEKK